jgi:hypothetical protein
MATDASRDACVWIARMHDLHEQVWEPTAASSSAKSFCLKRAPFQIGCRFVVLSYHFVRFYRKSPGTARPLPSVHHACCDAPPVGAGNGRHRRKSWQESECGGGGGGVGWWREKWWVQGVQSMEAGEGRKEVDCTWCLWLTNSATLRTLLLRFNGKKADARCTHRNVSGSYIISTLAGERSGTSTGLTLHLVLNLPTMFTTRELIILPRW